MHNNQARLLNLLDEHKITQDEYDILRQALNNKPKLVIRVCQFLINPYAKITTMYCLIIGLFIIVALAYVGYTFHANFSGFMGSGFFANKQFSFAFILEYYYIRHDYKRD